MKKIILVFCILLFLSACSAGGVEPMPSREPLGPTSTGSTAVEETAVYTPAYPLTIEETIEQYFLQQYNAYADLQTMDISYLLDMNQARNRNSLVWLESLIQRRALIKQYGLCYVDTTKYPYSISYEEEARDQRMEFWRSNGLINEEEIIVHFTLTGNKGQAYPPFMSMNAQHTMRLKEIDGIWKITFHYYPGSTRRFHQDTTLVLLSKEEMLEDLKEEFKVSSLGALTGKTTLPPHASAYDGAQGVDYAKTYAESRNPAFYDIEDWEGNCANFVSQCLWYGFGAGELPDIARSGNMTSQWYAGQGGGSPAWENVEHFWNYATATRGVQEQGLHGEIVETISQLELGSVIQLRTGRLSNADEQFNHILLLVDRSTMVLAQNSPDCLVYYSDLVNVDARFFNPSYLIK